MQRSVVRYTPARRLFLVLAGLVALGLVCFLWEWMAFPWLVLSTLTGLLLVADVFLLSRANAQVQTMQWDRQPTVQQPFLITLKLAVQHPPVLYFSVETISSDVLEPSKPYAHLEAGESGVVQASVEVFPRRRGAWVWPGVYVHFRSWIGFAAKRQHLMPGEIPVYPRIIRDVPGILNPNVLMDHLGLKINRYRWADQEFESLRPYVTGDNYRHIDWKASARLNNWIVRQFQVEHHHNILICLDSSRLMGTLTEGTSKLDWAIEATLHLAYLASRFGDRIGLLVFNNEVERWVKPLNRPVETFLRTVYNLECKIVEADFHKVCLAVMAAQKKRSLVIFLSDFLDASSLEPHLNAFGYLNQRHCSLFIGIEDPAYHRHLALDNGVESAKALVQKIVALDSMKRRHVVLQQLQQMGLRSLTVTPQNLVQQAMQAYMEIKLQGAI